ncbi:hypothetical protein [Rhizobium sp. 22-785-1]
MDDEYIFTTDIFTDFYENFLVRKPFYCGISQGNIEILADRFGQMPVRIACENLHGCRLFSMPSLEPGRFSLFRGQCVVQREGIPGPEGRRTCRFAMGALIALLPVNAIAGTALPMIFVKTL